MSRTLGGVPFRDLGPVVLGGPLVREGGLAIVADARVDNNQEIRRELKLAMCSDAHLLLHAYRKWGSTFPSRLYGDFAFALWDEAKAQLVCGRDQMGILPLYYWESPQWFIWASEIKAILSFAQVPDELDEEMVAAFFRLRPRRTNATYYRGVRRLGPAETIRLTEHGLEKRRYWSLQPVPNQGDPEEFFELLSSAVTCRMGTRNGVLLSGGLDSAGIAALLSRQEPVIAASSLLPPDHTGPESDERGYIDRLSLKRVLPVHDGGPFDELESRFALFEGPVDAFNFRDCALFRALSLSGVHRVFSGFAGDMAVSYSGRDSLARLARAGRLATVLRLCVQLNHRVALRSLLGSYLVRHLLPEPYGWLRSFFKPEPAWPVSSAFVSRHQQPNRTRDFPTSLKELVELGFLVIEGSVKACRRLGMEAVFPWWDRRLIEFVAGAPPEAFLAGGGAPRALPGGDRRGAP